MNSEGYGSFSDHRKIRLAHRSVWEDVVGPIPDGLCVLHRCDNRTCIRLSHLFLGTRADNNRDRDAKGRAAKGARHGTHTHPSSYRGERHARAKLTSEQVHAIRAERAEGHTLMSIAARYDMGYSSVRAIVTGKNWGWLPSR